MCEWLEACITQARKKRKAKLFLRVRGNGIAKEGRKVRAEGTHAMAEMTIN